MQRFIVGGLLAIVLCGSAGAGGLTVAGPVIVLEPATVDFGTVKQEATHRTEVTVRNDGTAALEIRGIDSDCGCTVAQLADSSLAPGEAVTLRVTLSTRHFSGQIAKHIILDTNDPGAPKAKITLKAFVREMVRVTPVALDFGTFARGGTPSAVVTLRSARSDTLRLGEVVVPAETLSATVAESASEDTLEQRITFRVRADAPVGAFRETALIHTNHRLAKTLKIQVSGQIYSFFRAEPAEISLGQVRQGQTRQRSVVLRGEGDGSHRVLAASCSQPELSIALKTVEDGRLYEVAVAIPADMPPGRIDGVLRVTTDDPAQPELLLPVRGTVRRARGDD